MQTAPAPHRAPEAGASSGVATTAERHKAKSRARARLAALGIDVDAMGHDQIRAVWESSRTAYINIANAGLHMSPVHVDGDALPGACAHARFGMLADAIRDWFGAHPEGWSPARVAWPHHGDPPQTITVRQDDTPALPPAAGPAHIP